MYNSKQSFSTNKKSFRSFNGSRGGFNNRFNRPGRFNRGRARRGSNSRSQFGSDTSMFIKKAIPTEDIQTTITHQSFAEFNLNPVLFENITKAGFSAPTPIQDQAITPILQGKDLIGLASTGTGKTGAFLIPLIQKLFTDKSQRAIIIAPTRELAMQIQDEFRKLSNNMYLFSTLIIGGANMFRQIQSLQKNPSVVIGTPGRIKDLLRQRKLDLRTFNIVVLDEVDLMVDIGFINEIKYFISLMPQQRQSLFFSATISRKVEEILHSFVKDPVSITIKKQSPSENVDQDVIRVNNSAEKLDKLHDLLIKDNFQKVLIFGKTKHGIDKLHNELSFRGFKIGTIHGNKRQSQRQRILASFKNNEFQILLATDVASRGLDIDNVTHVINYDLPDNYEDYIHRIGRTGRAGKTGTALTFVS